MKSCLTRARTANNEHIFIDIVLGILVSAHHDALGLSEQNVLVKLGVNERGYVFGSAPAGAAVFHTSAVLLGVLCLEVHRHSDGHSPDQANEQVLGVKAGQRISGDELAQAGHHAHGFLHHVRPRRQPPALAHPVKKPE